MDNRDDYFGTNVAKAAQFEALLASLKPVTSVDQVSLADELIVWISTWYHHVEQGKLYAN